MPYCILDLETCAIDGCEDYLSPVAAPANYKDPAKVAAYVAEKAARDRERAALDVDLARIVCLGFELEDVGPRAWICHTDDEERAAVRATAARLDGDDYTIVTFNGLRYDLPLLVRRCAYLGVPMPDLTLDRYRTPHIDLYDRLTHHGLCEAHGLRWYAKRLGWTDLIDADPLPEGGASVVAAIRDGRWADVAEHCTVDLALTKRLASWLGVLTPEAVTR